MIKQFSKYFILILPFWAPLYLVKVNVGIPTNLFEIFILAGLLLEILFLFKKSDFSKLINLKPYFLPISFIFLGLFISSILNPNLLNSLGIVKGWFILPIFSTLLIYLNIENTKDIKFIIGSYIFSAFIVSLIALGYLVSGKLTYDGRLNAIYLSPNFLAMYIAPALIAVILNFKFSILKQIGNCLYLVSFILFLVTIYFTYSYATWLAIIGALFISQLLVSNKIKAKHILLSLILITLLVLSQISNDKLRNIFDPIYHSSLESRIAIWKSAGYILKDHWLAGIGPANFQEKYLEYQKYFPPYPEWAVPHPHNVFLMFWLGSGLFGLFGFVWLLLVWLKETWIKTKQGERLAMIFLAIIIYTLLHGLVDTTIWKNDLAFIFWIIVLAPFDQEKSIELEG